MSWRGYLLSDGIAPEQRAAPRDEEQEDRDGHDQRVEELHDRHALVRDVLLVLLRVALHQQQPQQQCVHHLQSVDDLPVVPSNQPHEVDHVVVHRQVLRVALLGRGHAEARARVGVLVQPYVVRLGQVRVAIAVEDQDLLIRAIDQLHVHAVAVVERDL